MVWCCFKCLNSSLSICLRDIIDCFKCLKIKLAHVILCFLCSAISYCCLIDFVSVNVFWGIFSTRLNFEFKVPHSDSKFFS